MVESGETMADEFTTDSQSGLAGKGRVAAGLAGEVTAAGGEAGEAATEKTGRQELVTIPHQVGGAVGLWNCLVSRASASHRAGAGNLTVDVAVGEAGLQ